MKLLDQPAGLDDRTTAYFFAIDHPSVDKVGVLYPVEYGTTDDGGLLVTPRYDSAVVECAFFAGGEWFVDSVVGFTHEDPEGFVFSERYPDEGTRVYENQSREDVEAFLAAHNGRLVEELTR